MSTSSFARGPVAISIAIALAAENGAGLGVTSGSTWSFSHLPRTVLTNFKPGECGKQQPGYVTIAHASWNTSWHAKVADIAECKAICDSNPVRCVGFEAHYPQHGMMRCKLYKGLMFEKDHIGLSFSKCTKAMPCHDEIFHRGFQFSHAGTWRGATEMEDLAGYAIGDCASACRGSRACVGFTFRGNGGPPGFEQCMHFLNNANKQGPRHDLRAHSYFKCVEGSGQNVVQAALQDAPEAAADNMTENASAPENATEVM
ncbi:unnamed protein product [Prorocentrum cordatum]|uniref:Apple domain-containing protein n=1 Tax=Prorocentrum cordatum TaxID=2364126 RepID=A0ABN9Q4P2_9DINO|nr:unnamed protein product [Polarella glacialis]